MRRNRCLFITLLACLLAGLTVKAQVETKSKEEKAHRKKIRHLSDSTWKKDFKIIDTSAALIINRIQDINNTLNTFSDVLEKGYDTSDISEELPRSQRNLNIIKYNISSLSGSLNLRNLSLFQDILGDITDDLKGWQTALISYYTEL